MPTEVVNTAIGRSREGSAILNREQRVCWVVAEVLLHCFGHGTSFQHLLKPILML
jgi:hypothetical protein